MDLRSEYGQRLTSHPAPNVLVSPNEQVIQILLQIRQYTDIWTLWV